MDSHRSWPGPPQPGRDGHGAAEQRIGGTFGSGASSHPTQHSPPSTANGQPTQGAPFSSYHQSTHNLANLAGISQSPTRQGPPPAQRADLPPSQHAPAPGFGLPGIGQPSDRERERERERAREVEHIQMQEEEERRHRDMERQRLEQGPPPLQAQPGPPVHIHQPVAVGPRSVHGPNGLLGNSAMSGPQPHSQIGNAQGAVSVFAGGPVQQVLPAAQHMQQGMLGPYGTHAAPSTQPQTQPQQQAQGQQPILNDALSYLDQVKVQFQSDPNVYNNFLDIMKDFKSGQIDTPGVINRVSSLFAGNPDLIQGFNTFLPPGYRIECGAGDDPNTIRVTTPMGTTNYTMPQRGQVIYELQERPTNGSYTPQPGAQPGVTMYSPNNRPAAAGQAPSFMAVADSGRAQEALPLAERVANSLQSAVTAASTAPGLRPGLSPRLTPMAGTDASTMVAAPSVEGVQAQSQVGVERRPPVEFNHAISYVNKIKTRFASQPDIYKQFLEILQTYQRESKPIQDVYTQVTQLFKTAPDLLDDFKQFLPESAAHARAAERARMMAEENVPLSNVRGDPAPYGSPIMAREGRVGTPGHGRGLPPVGNFAPTPASKDNNKRKRPTDAPVQDSVAGPSSSKQQTAGQPGKRMKHVLPVTKGANDQPPPSPTLIPALPTPIEPTTTSAATSDELAFFDKAKKVISNKNVMNEFLKLCNLFSQDLIDRPTLLYRASTFLSSSPDLFKWFQDWLGVDERDIIIENKPRIPSGRVMLSNCRGLGPSYRLLPKRERQKICSGRDELCNSVLNDEWASHPTWASEDSGFVAHRKNVHEEGLHRIEEERHDYDYNIEACARTIQLLEPIASSLRRMDDNTLRNYKLPPNLGGSSEMIYKRVIMKLYGREKGHEVIDSLQQRPYSVIPVLLNRLKERLETWKSAQREWEKIWREQTQKMFWKSLDHQAVLLKNNDRRQFQVKTLQAEIQVKYEEMKRANKANPGTLRLPQMEFVVRDTDVIIDATYLILRYIEENLATDHPRLMSFVRDLFAIFFGLDTELFREKIDEKLSRSPQNGSVDEAMSGVEDSVSAKARKGVKNPNLLRAALDRGRKSGRRDREGSNASGSRASTPEVASNADDEMAANTRESSEPKQDVNSQRWLDHPTTGNKLGAQDVNPNEPQQRETYRFWANTTIYCFMRLFIMLCERLDKVKSAEASVRELVANAQQKKPAIELGIMDKIPSDFFEDTSLDADYYAQMLNKLDACLQGEIEFADIEDILRRFYLQVGYPLYGFEKLVSSLARTAVQVMNSDAKDKSADICQAFKKDRTRDLITAQQQTDYRRAVEKMVKDADLYRIDFEQATSQIRIYLAKKDIPIAEEIDEENRWRYYIASYTSFDMTEGVDQESLKKVVLTRNIDASQTSTGAPSSGGASPSQEDQMSLMERRMLDVKSEEKLNIRIAVNNYRSFFQIGTHEGFHALPVERARGVDGAQEVQAVRDDNVRDVAFASAPIIRNASEANVEKRAAEFKQVLDGTAAIGDSSDKMDVDE